MKARMQPVDTVWAKFPRVVRDLATACGKEVSLDDARPRDRARPRLVEAVRDPLTHLVRNAVDHGIERPSDRVAAGKPRDRLLVLRAFHESRPRRRRARGRRRRHRPGEVVAKAVERGLVTPAQAATMSDHDALALSSGRASRPPSR